MKKSVRAYAPASIGNVSCGFDVMGMAVDAPGDEVIITLNDSGKVTIKNIEGDGGKLPLNAEENTAGVGTTTRRHPPGRRRAALKNFLFPETIPRWATRLPLWTFDGKQSFRSRPSPGRPPRRRRSF